MVKIGTKTVREVATELNVSKQAIHKKINQLPPTLKPKKIKGAYRLSPKTVDYIRTTTTTSTNDNQNDNQPSDNQVDGEKAILKELKRENERLYQQLETKDSQLKERDKLLSDLTKIIDQQQQLTLRTDNRYEKLEIELESLKEETQLEEKETIIEETQATKRWWHFFK